MGRITFTEDNKVSSGDNFPKLKLGKGEYARLVAIEDPEAEFVHRLQMPKIVNGQVAKVTKERKNGEKYEDYDYDFVGNPICLGDEGILLDKGVDPANCPACAMARSGDMTSAPQRRFAMHVIKYATKPGGTDIQTPFAVSIIIWAFTAKRFDKLVDLAKEHGDLRQKDLLLGPCTNEGYQNYDVNISGKAEWLIDDARKKLAVDTFQANQTADLSSYCGRKVEKRWMQDDLDKIVERWRIVNGAPADTGGSLTGSAPAAAPTLDAGLNDLLATTTGQSAPSPDADTPPAAPALPDDLFARKAPEAAETPAEAPAAPAATASPDAGDLGVKPGSSGAVVSFEDLLKTSN